VPLAWRALYSPIQPATASTAAIVLKPNARTISPEASSAGSELAPDRPWIGCRTGFPPSFTNATRAAAKTRAEKSPRICPNSSIAGVLEDLRSWRQRPYTVAARQIVMHQPCSRACSALGHLQRGPFPAKPICIFHRLSPASESIQVSLCHRALGCDLR